MQYKLECMVKLRTSWDILITAKSLQMYITINNLEAFCYITNQLLQKYSIWKKQKGFAIFFGAWEILNDKNIIRKWAEHYQLVGYAFFTTWKNYIKLLKCSTSFACKSFVKQHTFTHPYFFFFQIGYGQSADFCIPSYVMSF